MAFPDLIGWLAEKTTGFDRKKEEERARKNKLAIDALEKKAYQRAKSPQQKKAVVARIGKNNAPRIEKKENNFNSFLNSAGTNIIYNNPLSVYAWKNWYDQGREVLGTALNNEQLRQSGTNALQGRRSLEAYNYDRAANKGANVAGAAFSGVLNAATNPFGRAMANPFTRTGIAGARYGLGSASDTGHAIREAGGSRNAQLAGMGATGVTSTLLGSYGLGKMTNPTGAGLKGVFQAAAGEGAEELVEYGVDDAVARATYDPNRSIKESAQNALMAAGTGFVSGGLLRGATEATTRPGRQSLQQDAIKIRDAGKLTAEEKAVIDTKIKEKQKKVADLLPRIDKAEQGKKKASYETLDRERKQLIREINQLKAQRDGQGGYISIGKNDESDGKVPKITPPQNQQAKQPSLKVSESSTDSLAQLSQQKIDALNEQLNLSRNIDNETSNLRRSQLTGKALNVPSSEVGTNDLQVAEQSKELQPQQKSLNQTTGKGQKLQVKQKPTAQVQVQDTSFASSFGGDYTNQDAESQFDWAAPARNPKSRATQKLVADISADNQITEAAIKAEQDGTELNYFAKKDKNGRGVGIEKFNPNKHSIEAGFITDKHTGKILGNHIKVDESGISVNVSGQEVNVSNIVGNPQDWDGNYRMMETMDRNLKNNAPDDATYRRTRRFLIDHKTKEEAKFREELGSTREDLRNRAKDVMSSKPSNVGKNQYKEDIFDYIEGNLSDAKLKSKYDAEAVAKIRQYKKDTRALYDSLLERVNETFRRFGEEEVSRRKDYLTHINELNNKSWYAGELYGRLQNSFLGDGQQTTRGSVPGSIAGRTEGFEPRKKWNRFFQPRRGNETVKDPFANVDSYVEPTLYNIYMTESGVRARAVEAAFRTASEIQQTDVVGVTDSFNEALGEYKTSENGKLIAGIQEYANALAGKTQRWDRQIIDSSKVSAGALKNWQQLQRIGGRATILANASSIVSQSLNQPLAIAKAGAKNYMQGVAKGLIGKTPIDQSAFIKARETDVASPFRSNFDKTMDVMGMPLQKVELAFVKNAWNAMYQKATSEGFTGKDAILEADRLTEQTVAGRGIADKPEAYRSTAVNGLLQYTLEVSATNKAFFQDLSTTQKAEFVAATFAMNSLVGLVTGFEPLPDFLGAALDSLEDFTDEEDERSAQEKAAGTVKRFGGELVSMNPLLSSGANIFMDQQDRKDLFGDDSDVGRFEGTAAPIKVVQNTKDAVFSIGDALRETDEDKRNADLLNARNSALRAFVPGGNQARKTITGAEMNQRGYHIDRAGNPTFPAPQNGLGKAQAVTFGPSSTKEARNYYDNNQSGIKGESALNRIKISDNKAQTVKEIQESRGQKVESIKIADTTQKNADGKYTTRDKYDAIINAFTKRDGELGNIQNYDNAELQQAIQQVASEAEMLFINGGMNTEGIKFDSRIAKEYSKLVKDLDTANDIEANKKIETFARNTYKSQLADIEQDLYTLSEDDLKGYIADGTLTEENLVNALRVEEQLFNAGLISKETLARKLDLDARGYKTAKSGRSGRKGSKGISLPSISMSGVAPKANLFKVSAPPSASLPSVSIKKPSRPIRIKRG